MPNKAIRFSEKEYKEIQEFLNKNPLFDFSSLAKFAIDNFIKKPAITITPIKSKESVETKEIH